MTLLSLRSTGVSPPDPNVTSCPAEATPEESITNRYAVSDAPKLPCRTVAVMLVFAHDVGVAIAQLVELV